MTTKGQLPESAEPFGERASRLLQTMDVVPVSPILTQLAELQSQRTFCIKSKSRCDRSTEAMIARSLGYRADQQENERKAVWKQAAAIRKLVEGGKDHTFADQQIETAVSTCSSIILLSAQSRAGWDAYHENIEEQMRRLARSLPVWTWVAKVKGFGDLGLAIIVAETGDLANYATKERVWKRLGLAVIEGERQQRKTGAEAAAAQGYSPRRRAEIWSLCSDSMFRHQWNADKDEDGKSASKTKKPIVVPAHPAGPYGEIYARRKAATETREWSPGHRHNDARRIMTKALIEDLWRAWRSSKTVGGSNDP